MSFMSARVTREQLVSWAAFAFIKAALQARGFPDDQIEYKQSFQSNLLGDEDTADHVIIAAGFHADDGGHLLELGSTLRRKTYQLEYWVVAPTPGMGDAIKNAIAEACEAQDVIPLYDYSQGVHGPPVIGFLWMDENPARAERVAVPDPAPWQENLYLVNVRVTDDYYPAMPLGASDPEGSVDGGGPGSDDNPDLGIDGGLPPGGQLDELDGGGP